MKFTQQTIFATTFMALSICGLPAYSQSGGLFEITKSVIAGGGGNSAGRCVQFGRDDGPVRCGDDIDRRCFHLSGRFLGWRNYRWNANAYADRNSDGFSDIYPDAYADRNSNFDANCDTHS